MNYKFNPIYKTDEYGNRSIYSGYINYTFANGVIYRGDIINGLFDGYGVLKIQDIEDYIGEFKEGKYHGSGILYNHIEGLKRVGDFEAGVLNGSCIIEYENFAASYVGYASNGVRNARGMYFSFYDLEDYTGEYKNDKYDGFGVLKRPGDPLYIGEFKDGMKNGVGKFKCFTGKEVLGEFKDDIMIKKYSSEFIKKDHDYYLFLDTETSDLNFNQNNHFDRPRLIQLGYALYNGNGKLLHDNKCLIKPNGFTISNEAILIHGINNEMAVHGHSVDSVLENLNYLVKDVDYIVGHNIDFDLSIINSEFSRINMQNELNGIEKICTMKGSVDYCGIIDKGGYKYPKLAELHFKLFNCDFENAHDALIDVHATAKCFWELKKRKVIK